jgi:chromosome segregation protein
VFLKSLTLKGFKSFAETTTLEFEPGVTVVVGPNGSGKSNIVDAVAWVLGAQGPRTLRSTKMEDVIFAGTAKRPALGRAEVSLTIDNSAGLLPIDFSEVTITRTLFRSGDSEYAINGVPCRLLDVQELLSDTGVGRQQHVIVSQGQLDAILNAKPEDRRLVIEEAAGVLKYRRRREKAQRRLESTEGTLLRLQDLLREVRRQLRPLERQADAARRHGDLVIELAGIKRHLAGRELASIESRLGNAARTRTELARAEEDVRRALSELDAAVVAAEAELSGQGRTALGAEAGFGLGSVDGPDLADALTRAEGLRERTRGLMALLAERRRSVNRDLEAAMDRDLVTSLEAEAAQLGADLAGADDEAERLASDERDLAAAEAAVEAERMAFEAAWGPDGDHAVSAPVGAAAEARGELGARRASLERGQAELRRLDERLADLTQRAAALEREATGLRAAIFEADTAEQPLVAAARTAQAAASAGAAALEEATEQRRALEAEHHRWAARADALAMALDEARARAGAERLAGVAGVVGTLLELVEVDEGWEAAFEAAAGEAIAAVIVDGEQSARRSLQHLREQALAGAVLALPDVAAPPVPVSLPFAGEPVRNHVRARLPAVDRLLDRLLARAVAVDGGWTAALDLALAEPDLVVVTREGDRFAWPAWRAGATVAGATGAALHEAQTRTAELAPAVDESAGRVQEAERRLEEARAAEAEVARQLDANDERLSAANDALQRVEAESRDAATTMAADRAHRESTAERLARDSERVDELESLLPDLERAAAAESERILAERAARAGLVELEQAVAARRRQYEVRCAGIDSRRGMLRARLAEVDQRLHRHVAGRAEAEGRRQRLQRLVVATDRLHGRVAGRFEALDATVIELREARRRQVEAARAAVSRLEQLRRERGAAERQLAEIRERASRTELAETEARVRLEGLVETIRRELDCEPEATRDAPCPELPAGTSAASRVRELERELRLMGPINPLALQEYEALQDRSRFLEEQLEDVKSGRRELAKVIRAIDAEIIEVFQAAYSDVAEHFTKLFGTLFPGGQGRLRLTDPEHLLETGIEVEARPSGKNVKRLSLLSGGERSLTALAFLFAVFRARPSPFYLMDEVEAALDDVNLHRFLDLIHEFRDEAQLLVVSHQKRTMEAADCLYGVTMQSGGSSRVVSERIAAST